MTLNDELRLNQWSWATARTRRCVYRGPHGFVLAEGEDMTARPLPAGVPRGKVGYCFGNAIATAARDELVYVEGFLRHPRIAARSGRQGGPLHHAWNLDADGMVVDVTIPDELIPPHEREYRGVRFSLWRAHHATWHHDASILEDRKHGWPILRECWVPEESPGPVERVLHEMMLIQTGAMT